LRGHFEAGEERGKKKRGGRKERKEKTERMGDRAGAGNPGPPTEEDGGKTAL